MKIPLLVSEVYKLDVRCLCSMFNWTFKWHSATNRNVISTAIACAQPCDHFVGNRCQCGIVGNLESARSSRQCPVGVLSYQLIHCSFLLPGRPSTENMALSIGAYRHLRLPCRVPSPFLLACLLP